MTLNTSIALSKFISEKLKNPQDFSYSVNDCWTLIWEWAAYYNKKYSNVITPMIGKYKNYNEGVKLGKELFKYDKLHPYLLLNDKFMELGKDEIYHQGDICSLVECYYGIITTEHIVSMKENRKGIVFENRRNIKKIWRIN